MKYCAFLRGVNVKGTNMKMAEVCEVFKNAGMQDAVSVLASGNIIFSSDQKVEDLKIILEKAMSEHFNYEAFLFVKSKEEIENFWNSNPFDKNEDLHVYTFIGNQDVESVLMKEFESALKTENEDAKIVNGNFYWQVPKGNTLDSTFGKILGRKNMKDQFTSRNINTFGKILKSFNVWNFIINNSFCYSKFLLFCFFNTYKFTEKVFNKFKYNYSFHNILLFDRWRWFYFGSCCNFWRLFFNFIFRSFTFNKSI